VMACPSSAVRSGPAGPLYDRAMCRVCPGYPCAEACPQGALGRVGRVVEAGELMTQIAADAAFYRNSGGGVTFSGGEPFTQPEFLEELLGRCRTAGIRTAVETCGLVPVQTLLDLEPLVGLFLFDVKVMDPERHARYTGNSNGVILQNLRALAGRARSRITVRVPLVPGCTDSQENVAAIAGLVSELALPGVELMPYHELGRDKYGGLGREYPIDFEGPDRSPDLDGALRIFASRGIPCEVNGE
jgi:pyruvate formate lyase activating enzyme